jgi:hypothetical protein
MNRPSSPWLTGPVDDPYDDPIDRVDEYDEYDDSDEYGDYGDFDDEPDDRRWIWVAGVAGVILLIAIVGTAIIVSGGDSGTTSATVAPTSSRPAAPSRSAVPSPSATRRPAPTTSLAPETLTTVSPSPEATAAPRQAAPPPVDPRTVVYRVTGSRNLIDLVTIIYTDQQGALRTDVNVALPWSKTVVLDPGVELGSVTATSVAGQLNCTIADASGATVAAQNNNAMIATCTK